MRRIRYSAPRTNEVIGKKNHCKPAGLFTVTRGGRMINGLLTLTAAGHHFPKKKSISLAACKHFEKQQQQKKEKRRQTG